MASETTVDITDNERLHRYEAHIGGELAGFAVYERSPGVIAFTHTVVDEEFEGHGVASRLATNALGIARESDLRVVPICPFFSAYTSKHPEWADLVRRAGTP